MNKKIISILSLAILLVSTAVLSLPLVSAKPAGLPRGSAVILVVDENHQPRQYFDTIVPISQAKGLPWNPNNVGSFQQLFPSDTTTSGFSETYYGPGDPGYRGGRWWIDDNGNGYQDANDVYFLCPLLGPGRDTA